MSQVVIRRQWLLEVVGAIQSLAPASDGDWEQRLSFLASLSPPSTPLERLIFHGIAVDFSCRTFPPALRSIVDARLRSLEQGLGLYSPPVSAALGDRASDLAWKARHIIDKEYAREIGVEALSRRLGVHRNVIGRAFRSTFDVSVHDYLTAVRIGEADALLINDQHKIEAVASAVGFKSRSAFSVRYRQLTGHSPEAIRAELHGVHPRTRKCIQEHESR